MIHVLIFILLLNILYLYTNKSNKFSIFYNRAPSNQDISKQVPKIGPTVCDEGVCGPQLLNYGDKCPPGHQIKPYKPCKTRACNLIARLPFCVPNTTPSKVNS